jgi:hypothetical protein
VVAVAALLAAVLSAAGVLLVDELPPPPQAAKAKAVTMARDANFFMGVSFEGLMSSPFLET